MVEMDTGTESINICQQKVQQQKTIQPQLSQAAITSQVPSSIIGGQSAILQPPMTLSMTVSATPLASATSVAPTANPFIPSQFNPVMLNAGIAAPNLINPIQPFTIPPFNLPLNPANANFQPNPAMWPNPMMPTADPILMMVEPEIREAAAEWQEYKSQDGKPYYFSNKTKQSVWNKPKALIDLDSKLKI